MTMTTIPGGPPGGSPAGLDLGSNYGVMLLSTIIVAALYGVTVLQTLYYYEKFPKDGLLIKIAVAAIWVLDTLTIVFDSHAIYYYLIDNFNNPPALQKQVWSAQAELLVTYTIVLLVQFFFIHRMYHLRPHLWYIPAVMAILAVASYIMVIVVLADVLKDTHWTDIGGPIVSPSLEASWVLGMVVDIGITVILCWYLWSERGNLRTKTTRLLNRIIIFMVHRGAIAAVVQIMTLLTTFIWPNTLVFIAFHNALSKVYANSMLATLNARTSLRKMVIDTELDATVSSSPFSQSRSVSRIPVPTLQFARNSVFDSTGGTMDIADIADYAEVNHRRLTDRSDEGGEDKYDSSFIPV